nr:hypothetical protein [Tanacetum cinerariifolium]
SQISATDKTGLGYDGHVNESEVLNNVVDSCESDEDDNQVNDRFKKSEGYHAVPLPYTGNYMPPRVDLSFARLDDSIFKSEESDIEDENVFESKEVKKIIKPSLEKIEFVNVRNTTIENENKGEKPRKFSHSPRARGKAYVPGEGDTNPDSNVIKDVSYAIELADERVSETNTMLRGCALVNTAHNVSVASSKDQASTASYADDVMFYFFSNQSNTLQLYNEDLKQIDIDDLKEMDLKWQVSKLTMRVKRKFETSSKNLTKLIDSQISATNKTGLGYDGHVNESEVLNNVVDGCESDRDNNQVNDRFKKSEGYHAVPSPYIGNYMPPRADLSFARLDDSVFKSKVSETIISVSKIETNASKTSKDSLKKPKTIRSSAPIIEDWKSNSEDKNVFESKEVKKTVKPSLAKIKFVNARNTTVENENKAKKPRKFSQSPRVLTKSKKVPVNTAKQSSQRAAASVSTSRHVNTAASRPNVNSALPKTYSYFKAHSPVRRPFNKKSAAKTNNFNEKVNNAKVNNVTTIGPKALVSAAEENRNNVVKSSACWIWRPKGNVIDYVSKDSGSYTLKRFNYGNPQYALQDQGIFDSGYSRHMTGNKSYLTDYQKIDGGFVAFGENAKGDKITRKGKIRTGKLDFEDVYLVKELKFNLFSISQICDKKNDVLFTNTECVVLSPLSFLMKVKSCLRFPDTTTCTVLT